MKLPKILWNATYQALVQERDSWKELAELWSLRADHWKTLTNEASARNLTLRKDRDEARAELATHVAANLARLAKAPKRDAMGKFAKVAS